MDEERFTGRPGAPTPLEPAEIIMPGEEIGQVDDVRPAASPEPAWQAQLKRNWVPVSLALAALCCGCSLLAAVAGGDDAPPPAAQNQAAEAQQAPFTTPPTADPTLIPTAIPPAAPTLPPTQSPVGRSLQNPAPPGTPVEVPLFRFRVDGALRPADAIVEEAYFLNKLPIEGEEYIAVSLSLTCINADGCTFDTGNMGLIDSAGVVHQAEWWLRVPGLLETTELIQDASLSGEMYYLVPQADPGPFILEWEPWVGDSVYLQVP